MDTAGEQETCDDKQNTETGESQTELFFLAYNDGKRQQMFLFMKLKESRF